jgi:hypothetical protein
LTGLDATGARSDGGTEIEMGYVHMDKRAMDAVLAVRGTGKVISHITAAMIVDAFTHGWATCWFAETGNFAVATECLPSTCAGEPYEGRDPVEAMDEHLWWWMADHDDPWDDQGHVPILREEMRRYMEWRWRGGKGECGTVEGWQSKPFA